MPLPNGVGKTTLIKTIAQRQNQLEGEITFGANLQIGYYDQKQAEFKSNKTIIDYVWDQYPTMNEKIFALYSDVSYSCKMM